jgi:rSAM/selenodomain-associated transferase 1
VKTLTSFEKCILVFVRFPERGMIKSRLSKDLNEDIVLRLYKNFVFDILNTLKRGKHFLKICFHPPDSKEKISDWLGEVLPYMPQKGRDLGERMKNAFIDTFSDGFSKVILIGSDIPDLTITIINRAFELDMHDAVIGPSADGGYYLIGFKKSTFLPDIFEGIKWGTEKVFERTMEILRGRKYLVQILPQWQDVDRLDDLNALFYRNQDTEFKNSQTMTFLYERRNIFLI